MGNTCCSVPLLDTSIRRIALKLPHGSKGAAWDAGRFVPVEMNQWLSQLYANKTWTGYFCYNDDLPQGPHTTRGHCKGIVTWNESRIGWLIHSVPRFPDTFNGSTLSPIGHSELVYGQSFLYVEQSRAKVPLEDVLRQILWMKPNLFHVHNLPPVVPYSSSPLDLKSLRWSPTVTHLSKSPDHATDYIGTELAKMDNGQWHEETWKRGCEYHPKEKGKLHSIHTLCLLGTTFHSTQDHSKWAASPNHVWIGDLNHMKSQEKRGGGGMVMRDPNLATALQGLVKAYN